MAEKDSHELAERLSRISKVDHALNVISHPTHGNTFRLGTNEDWIHDCIFCGKSHARRSCPAYDKCVENVTILGII